MILTDYPEIQFHKYISLNYINSNEFTCNMLPRLFIAVISVRQTSEKQLTYNKGRVNGDSTNMHSNSFH